ncbi:hypothetical protein L3X38_005528 [Prunus dulcis]|uniref:Uncharacterized protein n=1 Tax=Prunus dulcis TaxID=3755 RepID=A0AAD5F471_PRUDU|nr:hypothetical protein L3X38_005528 [Prunus dulcis]
MGGVALRAIPPSSPSPRLGGCVKNLVPAGQSCPVWEWDPTKIGWPEGQFRPRGDDVRRDVIARFQIFLLLVRANETGGAWSTMDDVFLSKSWVQIGLGRCFLVRCGVRGSLDRGWQREGEGGREGRGEAQDMDIVGIGENQGRASGGGL